MLGTLYIVGTPIGNLQDITQRAKDTLASVDAILCEDTRVTQKMLGVFGISKPLIAYHQHSDDLRIKDVAQMLQDGKSLALVTDAGTPGISDPGGKLVEVLVKQFGDDLCVTPIPGASALMCALSISGFPADEFCFMGFPPHKKGRQSFFKKVDALDCTVAYFESTHRIEKSLEELAAVVGNRSIVLCRELTKLHETIYRGSAHDVLTALRTTSMKGEFVVVVSPK